MGRKPSQVGAGLSIERILTAAWELVEEEGLDGLSTRTLAARLDVKSSALYWHIKNKAELLSLMLERVLQQSFTFDDQGLEWKEVAWRLCHQQHAAMLAHRDSGRIASIAVPSARIQSEIMPRMYQPFLAAGLDEEDALAAAGLMITFILGWVIYEQRTDATLFIESLISPNVAFAKGVQIFLEGVEQMTLAKKLDAVEAPIALEH